MSKAGQWVEETKSNLKLLAREDEHEVIVLVPDIRGVAIVRAEPQATGKACAT